MIKTWRDFSPTTRDRLRLDEKRKEMKMPPKKSKVDKKIKADFQAQNTLRKTKNILKEFTANVDIRLFGKDEQDVIRQIDKLLHPNKYWIGDITS